MIATRQVTRGFSEAFATSVGSKDGISSPSIASCRGSPLHTGVLGLAIDLVDLKVDLIVAIAGPAVLAKEATSTVPIVFVVYADPVRLGLVTSLATWREPHGAHQHRHGPDPKETATA